MDDAERRRAARAFTADWEGRGAEKQDAQNFWRQLLAQVFGVREPEKAVLFEYTVKGDRTQIYVDAYIHDTKVLVEQKSAGVDLTKAYKQSDGSMLTPFQQARRYAAFLPHSMNPRWIVVCNFQEFHIHNMEKPADPPEVVRLVDLEKNLHLLDFLVDANRESLRREMELSLTAGELVGKIHDRFLEQYNDPLAKHTQRSLNILCVRLVFCLYAEDAGLFGASDAFSAYIAQYDAKDIRTALISLFRVLDTPEDQRADLYLSDDLNAFPYVNGGLFADESIVIPRITEEIKTTLLKSAEFDWSEISPTIFGAVFESTLNPETRRSGGMHYTSIENIHKVIDPLFLDDLKAELNRIFQMRDFTRSEKNEKKEKLRAYQNKLASLVFLDPAAGSGNFLTESYLQLRKLENQVLAVYTELETGAAGQIMFGEVSPIKVSISQFAGIEINDFAVSVAKTALWIAECQMMKETEAVIRQNLHFLPLKTNATIVEGNALQMNWADVVSKDKLTYIMGNPPFVGASMMSEKQKTEAVSIFGKGKRVHSIDYVGAWYHKSAEMMQNTSISATFVSTNSITQGEQVAPLWQKLLTEYGVQIEFAYRTFRWDSEAREKAAVHCVIIGITCQKSGKPKKIYLANGEVIPAGHINPYLIDAPDVLVESRGAPICPVPRMTKGNQPSDGGNLILSEEEREAMIKADPSCASYILRYVGSRDFINKGEVRYCLWLKGINPALYRKNPEVIRRLEAVREMREKSTAAPTRALSDKPYLFFSTPQTDSNYLCIPEVSSERRQYIPIGFMDRSVIASNKLLIIPDASLYHFGVLTSCVHMAWTRTVCGRLKSDYQYSGATVYNNFIWPEPSAEQKETIERTAQAILAARGLYPDASLADLYDPLTMPPELRKAHDANDRAVLVAYGMPKDIDEPSIVAWLMRMYQEKAH